MDISHLRYFLALCKEPNYTAAAASCYITRQAMKQSITALENYYGVELVHNERNKLVITPNGRRLEESAGRIIAEIDRFEQEIFEEQTAQKPVRVGVSRSLVPFYAKEILRRLDELNWVKQEAGTAGEVLQMLAAGELDCALVVDDGKIEGPFHRSVLDKHNFVVLVNKKDPLALKEELSMQDLQDRDLQMMSDPRAEYSCFPTVRDALDHAGVNVKFHEVPDYYSANYHVMEDHWLGMDRDGADFEEYSMGAVTDKRFEKDRFSLCLSLVSAKDSVPGVRMLERKLEMTENRPLSSVKK